MLEDLILRENELEKDWSVRDISSVDLPFSGSMEGLEEIIRVDYDFPAPIRMLRKAGIRIFRFADLKSRDLGLYVIIEKMIDEISKMNPYMYNISISSETAREKGLRDGDMVEIRSIHGQTVTGRLATRKGQHPQTRRAPLGRPHL